MERIYRVCVVAFGLSAVGISAARGDDGALDKLYGEGVHAYYSGDASSAHRHLSEAMKAGSRDPRVYYFRGLASLRLGYRDAAGDDFKTAATMESQRPDVATLVSQSLQRVQGGTRLAIEKHRTDAKLVAFQQRRARDAARYGTAPSSAAVAPPAKGAGEIVDAEVTPATNVEPAEKAVAEPSTPATEEMPESTPAAEPDAEPSAGPAMEPAAEPAVEPDAEPATEPAAEPAVEPAAEPAAESEAKGPASTAKSPVTAKAGGSKKGLGFGKLADIIGRSAGRVGAAWGKQASKMVPPGVVPDGSSPQPKGDVKAESEEVELAEPPVEGDAKEVVIVEAETEEAGSAKPEKMNPFGDDEKATDGDKMPEEAQAE